MLGVTRRRVNALISSGDVPAQRIGRQWVVDVDEFRRAAHNLQKHHGRPMTERNAWNAIQHGLPEPLALQLIQLTLIVVTMSILVHGTSVKPLLALLWRRS